MKLEKIGNDIRELLLTNDFFRFLIDISDYIAYGVSFLVVINEILFLGSFVNAVLMYLFILAVVLTFCTRKYISVEILYIALGFSYSYSFIKELIFMNTHTFMWEDFLGLIACVGVIIVVADLYKRSRAK